MTFSERYWFLIWCRYCGSRLIETPPRCVFCSQNSARASRFKRALGSRVRYLHAAPPIIGDRRFGLAGLMRFTLRIRLKLAGLDDSIPEALRLGMHIDAGYCLDAPERMPAGGCVSEPISDREDLDGDDRLPEQITVYRDDPLRAVPHSELGPESLDIPTPEAPNTSQRDAGPALTGET